MPKANSTLIMAAILAALFFFATPGVIWTFPEKNLVAGSSVENDKMNKLNAAIHAIAFGVILSFAYGPLWAIASQI